MGTAASDEEAGGLADRLTDSDLGLAVLDRAWRLFSRGEKGGKDEK